MPEMISIPSTTRYLGAVRRFVEAHARAIGFSSDAIEELKLAVDEACTTVINHAYSGNERGTVELTVSIEADRFTITIRDNGRHFEKDKYEEPNLGRSVQKRKGGGYGIFIMRHLMDDVSYRNTPDFNEVHLSKMLPGIDSGNGPEKVPQA